MLSIAGSDSGGGAGIQADLKAFVVCRVHGMTAITAITAQNTVGVTGVHAIPPEMIIAQVRAVSEDIGIDAVKIGMLGNTQTIEAVAQALDELGAGVQAGGGGRDWGDHGPRAGSVPVVLDPVMIAESGARLLESEARAALIELLLPRATVATPNIPEARALLHPDQAGPADDDAAALARAVHRLGPQIVIVTGGHRETATDVFFDGQALVEIPGERYPRGAGHGSGCTHSSVLAARLAWGDRPLDAARCAKKMAAGAVANGLVEIGAGAGPVDVIGLKHRGRPPAGF